MKKNILFIAWVALFSLFASNSQAQSLKDLLNKDNISKVVNAITGTPETIDMTGTWTYSGSAVEFESDNLLMKAGGAAAATMAENKLNEQLSKVGIKEGQMSFTFNADSTFTSTSNSMDLLFNSDKLLKLMTFLGSKTNSTALKTVSSLAENYDGMMLGFGLKK